MLINYRAATAVGIMICLMLACSGGLQRPVYAAASSASILGQAELIQWSKVITDVGLLSALVLFFTWTAWKREERLAVRITALETFVQNDLLECTKTCVETITDNTRAVGELIECLNQRPCLLEHPLTTEKLERIVTQFASRLKPAWGNKATDQE
jgi:hypothetical protein